jgi:hypothetical protein
MFGGRVRVVVLVSFVGSFGGEAGATEILRGPILVHPDDERIYRPSDAAFVDESRLLITFARGRDDGTGSVIGEGSFLRSYNVATDAFGPIVPLTSSGFDDLRVTRRR